MWVGAILTLSLIAYVVPPVALLVVIPPFWLEQALFQTAFLFDTLGFSLVCWFVQVALLCLPLLGSGKKQMGRLALVSYVILPVALYSLIGVAAAWDRRWPARIEGPEAELVSDALLLPAEFSPADMRWSPDGRFIAVDAQPGVASQQQGVILVLDAAHGEEIAEVPSGGHDVLWDEQDRVWVLDEDHWNVYAEPFLQENSVSLGYVGKTTDWRTFERWAFEPNEQMLAVAEPDSDRKVWNVQLWRQGALSYHVELRPRYPSVYGPRSLKMSFSPDGDYLALVISGWITEESAGPDELWLLQSSTRELTFLHEGKTKAWQIFDIEVQDLRPAWSPTAELVFGGGEFPVEAIDVGTGRVQRILGWNSQAWNLGFSHAGEWIAFERWPRGSENNEACHRCFGVLRYRGNQLVYLEGTHWPFLWYDWHPSENSVAVLTGESEHYRLLWWHLAEQIGSFSEGRSSLATLRRLSAGLVASRD